MKTARFQDNPFVEKSLEFLGGLAVTALIVFVIVGIFL